MIALNPEEEQPRSSSVGSTLERRIPHPGCYVNCSPGTSYQAMVREDNDLPSNRQSTAHTLDQMGKWNCHFDGRGVYQFLERVRELQKSNQMTD